MILVTGATGNVGRQVVTQLVEAGEEVRAISRDPVTAGLPDGVEVLAADLGRPETLLPVLTGVDRVFLFPLHGQLGGFLDLAAAAGVSRVVLLSAAAVGMDSNPLGAVHEATERVVAESGLAWTFLRPGAFMANDLAWAPGIRAEGVVREFGAGLALPMIDERDIAAVAVRALLDGGHAGQTYELTGPQALTPADRVKIIADTTGREVRFEELTREQARAALLKRVRQPKIADSILDAMAAAGAGPVSPLVRDLTGNTHTYAEWATFHTPDFA
jgi:uncharacterized protein YbjT (DUF2867 family)